MTGRVKEEANLGNDLLSSEIYATAMAELDIDVMAYMQANEEDAHKILEGEAPWLENCRRVLTKLRRKVPEHAHHRVLQVVTGTDRDKLADPDVVLCVDRARAFFDRVEEGFDEVVDLATCLLDFAFTRQGIDDELARVVPMTPPKKEEPKALPASRSSDQHQLPISSQFFQGSERFSQHMLSEYLREHPFPAKVKMALRDWKPFVEAGNTKKQEDAIMQLSVDSIYRIAMQADGFPVGDPLVAKVWDSSGRFGHTSKIRRIGHAALGLEALLKRKGISPHRHGIVLHKAFCRTCGSSLRGSHAEFSGPHGCCIQDHISQNDYFKALETGRRIRQNNRALEAVKELITATQAMAKPRYDREKGYEIRTSPRADGNDLVEVHLEHWEEGIWQEVGSRDDARRFARRALAEHERARALARQGEDTITQLTSADDELDLFLEANPSLELEQSALVPQQSTALVEMTEQALEVRQLESQMGFGKSVRVLATILGGLAFAFTQQYLVLALIGVAWVMSYAFMDHRALEAAKQKALGDGKTP